MTPINLPINPEPRVGTGVIGVTWESENGGAFVGGNESGGIAIAWAVVGVGGAEVAGLGDSTSHILDKCLAVTLPGLTFLDKLLTDGPWLRQVSQLYGPVWIAGGHGRQDTSPAR